MSNQDERRSAGTARLAAALAKRCAQVIVLSHQRGFLDRVRSAWGGASTSLELWRARTEEAAAPAQAPAPAKPKKPRANR